MRILGFLKQLRPYLNSTLDLQSFTHRTYRIWLTIHPLQLILDLWIPHALTKSIPLLSTPVSQLYITYHYQHANFSTYPQRNQTKIGPNPPYYLLLLLPCGNLRASPISLGNELSELRYWVLNQRGVEMQWPQTKTDIVVFGCCLVCLGFTYWIIVIELNE